jgi:hypothetical protein
VCEFCVLKTDGKLKMRVGWFPKNHLFSATREQATENRSILFLSACFLAAEYRSILVSAARNETAKNKVT